MCGFTLLKFLYLLAVLGLCCYLPALSRCGKWGPLSSCGAQAPPCGGLVALQQVGSFGIRDGTHVPCVGKQILNHQGSLRLPVLLTDQL